MEQMTEAKGKCAGCRGKKKPGLWCNICLKRARGGKPAKKGQKGYPKTLKVDETLLRAWIRESILESVEE